MDIRYSCYCSDSIIGYWSVISLIRWYDYPMAFLAADLMTAFIFSGSIFGGFAAYFVYGAWSDFYCTYRLSMEE